MTTQAQNLEALSNAELASFYNNIPGVKPVKKFRDRATAVKRILKALAENPDYVAPKQEQVVEEKVAKTERKNAATPGQYDLPQNEILKAHRANSARGRLIEMCTKSVGATFAELGEAFPQWNEAQLHKTIRMCNWYLGYEVRTGDDGRIRMGHTSLAIAATFADED